MIGEMVKEKKTQKEGKLICPNCGEEIKPDEPKKEEGGKIIHKFEKGKGPRSEICEFC